MKVLAVENNLELLKLLSHLLEKEGFETATATGGEEALARFRDMAPDIVCLDVLLDDISGFEVCRRMRAEDAEMPILLITSKSRPADINEGMAAGATEYMVKPFDLASIAALMHRTAQGCIARRVPGAAEDFFEFGDLRVYPALLVARRGGKDIALNLRETGILKLLHGQEGRVIANGGLASYCWRAPGTPDEKAVDLQMRQLRRKIEADPDSPLLIRSEGAGYVFG